METSREPQAHTGLVLYFLGKPHAGLRKLSSYYQQRGFLVFNIVGPMEFSDRLVESLPHAILIDLQSRNDLTQYLDVLRKKPSLLQIPRVAIVSATTDNDTAAAFSRDCDDTVAWPLKATDLSAKLFTLLAERNQMLRFHRDSRDQQGRLFRGDIAPNFLRPLLQLLYLGRQDAMVSVESEGRRGRLWFKEGKLIDGQVGALDWEESLDLVRRFMSGTFTISFQVVDRRRLVEINALQWLTQQEGAEAEARQAERDVDDTLAFSAEPPPGPSTEELEASGLSEEIEKTNPTVAFSSVAPSPRPATLPTHSVSTDKAPRDDDDDDDEESEPVPAKTLPALRALRDEDDEDDDDDDEDDDDDYEDSDDDDDDDDDEDDDEDDDDDNTVARLGIKIGRMTRAEIEQRLKMEAANRASGVKVAPLPDVVPRPRPESVVVVPTVIERPGSGRPNRTAEVTQPRVDVRPTPVMPAAARVALPESMPGMFDATPTLAMPAAEADDLPVQLDSPVQVVADEPPVLSEPPPARLVEPEPGLDDSTARLPIFVQLGAMDEEAEPPRPEVTSSRKVHLRQRDTSQPGLNQRDTSQSGVRQADSSQSGIHRPDYSPSGIRQRDSSQSGVRKPDTSHSGARATIPPVRKKKVGGSSDYQKERYLWLGIGGVGALVVAMLVIRPCSTDPGSTSGGFLGELTLPGQTDSNRQVVPALGEKPGPNVVQPVPKVVPGLNGPHAGGNPTGDTNQPQVEVIANPGVGNGGGTIPTIPQEPVSVAAISRPQPLTIPEPTQPPPPPVETVKDVLNSARAAEAAGRSQEAFALYAQAAEQEPNNKEAAEGRSRLQQRLSVASVEPGKLHINTIPYGSIYLDGEKVGFPPLHINKAVPRKYLIRVLSEQYGPCETSVEVKPGQDIWVHMKLEDDQACNRTSKQPTVNP